MSWMFKHDACRCMLQALVTLNRVYTVDASDLNEYKNVLSQLTDEMNGLDPSQPNK